MIRALSMSKVKTHRVFVLLTVIALFLMLGACSSSSEGQNNATLTKIKASAAKSYPNLKVVSYSKRVKTTKGKSKQVTERIFDKHLDEYRNVKKTVYVHSKKYTYYMVKAKDGTNTDYTCTSDLANATITCLPA
jgi:uncharacterized protein YktB (UPF0637 family)